METDTAQNIEVVRSHRTAIKAKWLPNSNRISVSRLDGKERLLFGWDYNLDGGDNYAQAIQRYVLAMGWDGVWTTGSTDDGAVAVWTGHKEG